MTGLAFAIGALSTRSQLEIPDPPTLLSRLNRESFAGRKAGLSPALCLKLYCDGQMIISNAGHLSPYRNNTRRTRMQKGGPPLGLFPNLVYQESALPDRLR